MPESNEKSEKSPDSEANLPDIMPVVDESGNVIGGAVRRATSEVRKLRDVAARKYGWRA